MFPSVELSEEDGIRSLHLGSSMIQSAMRLSAPNDLELAYTKYMMGFLLFHPDPQDILMIGLGGGSLAKFVYHRLPLVRTVVIEINPEVVAAARSYFFVPVDDDRLQVRSEEGSEYLASHPNIADVVMVDGFDEGCQVPALCTTDFYDSARDALKRNGVLVVNLLSRDKRFHDYMTRIENSFNGRVASVTVEPHGNVIAFAFKHSPGKRVWENLPARARDFETELALPFTRLVDRLQRSNPA
ncbi:polyamine aminopropyltransferase [Nitrosospira sp. Is2]|nr:polyamine aminopropyltransferase [Nitrosospira sp. Is2]PTR14423.1 spermidine synthase [Nitrosospira sp. Nsp2]WON75351.1 polyamine aminopropyltransferase [Nitrosospira sp. Is2]